MEEEQKGTCVGLGTCPAEAEAKIRVKGEEEGEVGKEGVGLGFGALGGGEVFGLVGSCGD